MFLDTNVPFKLIRLMVEARGPFKFVISNISHRIPISKFSLGIVITILDEKHIHYFECKHQCKLGSLGLIILELLFSEWIQNELSVEFG